MSNSITDPGSFLRSVALKNSLSQDEAAEEIRTEVKRLRMALALRVTESVLSLEDRAILIMQSQPAVPTNSEVLNNVLQGLAMRLKTEKFYINEALAEKRVLACIQELEGALKLLAMEGTEAAVVPPPTPELSRVLQSPNHSVASDVNDYLGHSLSLIANQHRESSMQSESSHRTSELFEFLVSNEAVKYREGAYWLLLSAKKAGELCPAGFEVTPEVCRAWLRSRHGEDLSDRSIGYFVAAAKDPS